MFSARFYTVLQFINVAEPAMTINSTKRFGREAQIFSYRLA